MRAFRSGIVFQYCGQPPAGSLPVSCTIPIDNTVVVFSKRSDESSELKHGFHFMHEREIVSILF